jgi:hypothetical protein
MAFTRVLLGFGVVTVFLILWRELDRRVLGTPDSPTPPAFTDGLGTVICEGGLLTLFAGLWFGSLGAGGAPLLFLVVGLLMELPSRLRNPPAGGIQWKAMASGVARIVLAGLLLGQVLG